MLSKQFITLTALLFLAGCSATPGDAAYRSGHPTQAAQLYYEGATARHDGTAARKLGLLIQDGDVPVSKYGNAGKWFKKGCDLTDIVSCHNVGVGYEYGQAGLPKDYAEARRYYAKAARGGYVFSQYNLASMYANKYFSNDVEGYKWMLIAQKNAKDCSSNQTCQWLLKDPPGHASTLRTRMSAEEIQTAQQLASKWLSAH